MPIIWYTINAVIPLRGERMNYLSVAETAGKWNISERSVRNYCAQERIPGAVLIGKTWHIPENAEKPARSNGKKTLVKTLLSVLQEEKQTM